MKATITTKDGVNTWSGKCPDCGKKCTFQIPTDMDDYAAVHLHCETCEEDVDELDDMKRPTGKKKKQKRNFKVEK